MEQCPSSHLYDSTLVSMTMTIRDFSFQTNAFDLTRKQPGELQMDYHQDKLSFFIIIKKGLNTQLLKIPPQFLKHLNQDLSSNAILIGPSSDQWQVAIFKKGNDIYLLKGWPQFLTDNSVKLDEFLLFTYHEENFFQVQIFSKNGCERLYLKKTRQEARRKKGRPTKTSFGSVHPHESRSLYLKKKRQEVRRKKGRPTKTSFGSVHPHESRSLYLKKTRREVRRKKGRPTKTSFGSVHPHESRSSEEDLPFSNRGSLYKEFPKPQIPIKIKRPEACKLVESFTSGKPYFKHLLTKCNVEERCLLPIATKFARNYISEGVKKIILWNSEGKYWEVTVIWIHSHSHNKRYSQFTTGWGKFVHDNKLKRGDICLFELEGSYHMKVHIFRGAPISLNPVLEQR